MILLVWIAGVFAGRSFGSRYCCGLGLDYLLEGRGSGVLSSLVTTALVVSSLTIWTARSRETRALREEWSALSSDSGSLLSIHLLERAGAWRDALRRNFEAAVVCAFLLPLMVFLLVFSIAVASPRLSPPMAWVITLSLTLGCGGFACLQVGAILLSVRWTRSEIDRQRREILDSLGGQGPAGTGPPSSVPRDAAPTVLADLDVVAVERELLGRQEKARRTAGTERPIAAVVLAAAALALLSMAAASAVYGDGGEGIVLAIVGLVGVSWASLFLRGVRATEAVGIAAPSPTAPASPALARIDEAVEQLDRARATAGRGRNAAALAAVLIVTRLWFAPGYFGIPSDPLDVANALFSNLALPLALFVVVWTAYRLDRIENLQAELRRWVLALARLEQAFWDRY
ncbi:MAG: hypothetical protein L3K23_03445 [Thermoplasmata archaeon]|nr:hypothetical protein [Thermoplasmata archaeon]